MREDKEVESLFVAFSSRVCKRYEKEKKDISILEPSETLRTRGVPCTEREGEKNLFPNL
jgi:hypothetical protein